MSVMEPETPVKVSRSVPMQILRGLMFSLIAVFLLLLLPLVGIGSLRVVYALVAGWLFHGIRVLPDFFGQWQSALVPLASLFLAWLVAHRLLRWWLATKKHGAENGWTMWRTGALLGLMLLCGAAAVAISGVAHQMMWLRQTRWIESSRDLFLTINNTRLLHMLLLEFDEEYHRQPHSLDELILWDDDQNKDLINRFVVAIGTGNSMPVLTRPGISIRDMNPLMILIVTDQVFGFHVVATADGSVTRITPEKLNAIIARGDWLLTEN